MITPPPSTMPVIFGEYLELWSELGLPDRMAPHELDDNIDNYNGISQADMGRVAAYMAAGDRGAAYMLLAEKTGNMAFLNTAQISTGSGVLLGGPAINANAKLQVEFQDTYPEFSIIEFSQVILATELSFFKEYADENGNVFYTPPTELEAYINADIGWLMAKGEPDPALQSIFPGRFFLAAHHFIRGEYDQALEYIDVAALGIVVSALKDEVLNSGVQFGISYSQAGIIAADGGSAETVLIGEETVEVFKDDTGKVVALFRSGDAVLDSGSSGIGLAPFPYTAENNPFVYSSTGGYVLGFLLAGISKDESIDALLSVASVASKEDEARNYIDDVRGVLGDVESPSRVGDLRDSFHKAIVLAADPLHSNKYSLQDMVGAASAEITTIALENSEEGLAVRRALYELKPMP